MLRVVPWIAVTCVVSSALATDPATAQTVGVPTDGLSLWLQADAAGGLDEDKNVATWQNLAAGAMHHASQTNRAWRPHWEPSVESLRGKPAIAFDGVDDFLHLPSLRIGGETTVFLVAENSEQTEGGSYWRTVLGGDDDSFRGGATKYAFGFRRAGLDRSFIANLYHAPDQPFRLTEPGGFEQPVRFHLYGFRRKGHQPKGMTLRVDGATVAGLTADKDPPDFPGAGYTIGQGGDLSTGKRFRFYRGRIAELLVYDRVLREFEVLRVEEYLGEKYGLPRAYAPPAGGLVQWLNASDGWQPWPVGTAQAALHNVELVPRQMNGRPAWDFGSPSAHIDFGGWRPPPDGSVFAVVRADRDQPARILRELPAIDPRWAEDGQGFHGQLAELLTYDRRLAAEEQHEIELYLNDRYSESPDPRCFINGTLIYRHGYNDQPYVVRCRDGAWLCVITTSAFEERGDDRTLVVTRSTDLGRTWSEPQPSIEPADMQQPSWATLHVTPYGRVYVFYNLRQRPIGQPAGIGYYFKYSDDGGRTWSAERYPLPLRKIGLDQQFGATGGWSVCPPITVGGDVLVSYSRFAAPGRSQGQGFVFRSDNLQTERDPAKVRWEMLPAGDRGIRADAVDSDLQEEHIITPLANGDLYCIWRTTEGHACHAYSRDGGRSWGERGPATYQPAGRPIKQPVACCRPYRTANGRYLLWFHNTGPLGPTDLYRPRDIVWLAGGQERDGYIHWSQPEVLLYGFDLPVRGLGMSYPDFIEQDDRLWITTTDKEDARIFEVDPTLLDGLWNQGRSTDVPAEGLICELTKEASAAGVHQDLPELPSLLHGGFTVDLTVHWNGLRPGQTLVDCHSANGKGWKITAGHDDTIRMELDDGRHPAESWSTDVGLLHAGRTHRVTFIVDGGPDLILALVDGVLGDGGEQRQRGWGRFSRRLAEIAAGPMTLQTAPSIRNLRIYHRPLRVSEAASTANK